MAALTIQSPTYGTCIFDATFKESHSFQNNITQNPVQSGAAINDHVYQQPIVVTCDIGVTDCHTANGQFYTSSSRALSAFDVLVALWQGAEKLTVTTLYTRYQNMVIKLLNPIRDKNTMKALRATVTFQQIITTSAVEISVSQKTSSYPQTTGKTNIGSKGLGGGGFSGGGAGFGSGGGGGVR